jgi:hypothetical protein
MLKCPACPNLNYSGYDHLSNHFLEMETMSNSEIAYRIMTEYVSKYRQLCFYILGWSNNVY